jgi:signal transduction histidine kinase
MRAEVACEDGMAVSDSEKMMALVELAGSVAHELNNIFTAVTGNLSLLDEDLGDGDTSARIGEVIRTAERGMLLSSKLQAFAGRQPLKRKRVDVNRLVGLLVQDLPPNLLNAVHLRVSLARGELPSFIDEDKLRASVQEVLRNALAAMPKTGGQIIVETRLCDTASQTEKDALLLRPGRYVLVAVSDTGKGMSDEVAKRAVDPLFTTKTPGINAGWGLSNCAGFVRQSGGYMTLASRVGLGTRVEFYLPLQAA